MEKDKKTIGITHDNVGALQRVVVSGHFGSELDAAKFALAYAINGGIQNGRSDGADTKWNVGSVDPSGGLRELISTYYPDEGEPYRLIEYLINVGLDRLAGNALETPDIYGVMFDKPSDMQSDAD